MKSQTFLVRRSRIHCLLGGDESKPAVVILPGLGMWPAVYRKLGEKLSENYRVVIVDLVAREGLDEFADHLQELLGQIGISKSSFIAHSMGGWPAIMTGRDYPERVDQVILVNSMGEPVERSLPGWAWAALYKSLRNLRHPIGATKIVVSFALSFLRHPRWMWEAFKMTTETDLVEDLVGLKPKVRLVWADNDEYFPYCRRMASALRTKAIVIPKAGHDWIILESEVAAKELKKLLEKEGT